MDGTKIVSISESPLGDMTMLKSVTASPIFLATVLGSYVYFAKVFGPRFMANRPAYSLKIPLLAYNLAMVAFNGYLLIQFFNIYSSFGYFGLGYVFNHLCNPLNIIQQSAFCFDAMVLFYLSKIADLMDTVFFVLRKKFTHITFLHLFHHTSMVLCSCISVFYIEAGDLSSFCGALNAFVHTIMYTYYFLAAMGPNIQKYLWWKRYLTQLQMVQFLMVIGTILALSLSGCKVNTWFQVIWFTNTIIFLGLFTNFYKKTYKTE